MKQPVKKYIEVSYIESSVDNRKYLVQNIENKEVAADMLARLNEKITKLLEVVCESIFI